MHRKEETTGDNINSIDGTSEVYRLHGPPLNPDITNIR